MVKRPNGEGSVFEVRRGGQVVSWRATMTVGFDAEGKQVRVTGEGKTRRAALDRREQNLIKYRVKMGEAPIEALRSYKPSPREKVLTVTEWLDQWLSSLELEESTYLQYESRIRLHIKPALGDYALRLLEGKDILTFFNTTLAKKTKKDGVTPLLGKTAQRSIYFILFAAFEDARKQGKLLVNPCEVMKPPKRNVKSYDERQATARLKSWAPEVLAAHIMGHEHETRWMIGLIYGWRQSEILGLTDDCFSWGQRKSQSRIFLKQQLARNPDRHGCLITGDGKWSCGRQANSCPSKIPGVGMYVKKRMKTEASYRVLPLVEPVYTLVKQHIAKQQAFRETDAFKPLPGDGMDRLLFTNSYGFPRRHQTDSREWHQLLKDAGVPDVRGHEARAWMASLLISMGVDQATVKLAGGWNNDSAMEHYVHRASTVTREPLEALSKRVTSRRK